MNITVRPMEPFEGSTFLEMHSRSVRGLGAHSYSPEVLDAWAAKFDPVAITAFLRNPDNEIRLIAEIDGTPAGLGAIVVSKSELRACYVVPEAVRRGVGAAIVREIERIARQHALKELELLASLNAQPFYERLGYKSEEQTSHVFSSGIRMPAIRMRKRLK
jgi:putative acetyltransferase